MHEAGLIADAVGAALRGGPPGGAPGGARAPPGAPAHDPRPGPRLGGRGPAVRGDRPPRADLGRRPARRSSRSRLPAPGAGRRTARSRATRSAPRAAGRSPGTGPEVEVRARVVSGPVRGRRAAPPPSPAAAATSLRDPRARQRHPGRRGARRARRRHARARARGARLARRSVGCGARRRRHGRPRPHPVPRRPRRPGRRRRRRRGARRPARSSTSTGRTSSPTSRSWASTTSAPRSCSARSCSWADLPRRVRVVGIQPAEISLGTELSAGRGGRAGPRHLVAAVVARPRRAGSSRTGSLRRPDPLLWRHDDGGAGARALHHARGAGRQRQDGPGASASGRPSRPPAARSLLVREPGGTAAGERIRAILMDRDESLGRT